MVWGRGETVARIELDHVYQRGPGRNGDKKKKKQHTDPARRLRDTGERLEAEETYREAERES